MAASRSHFLGSCRTCRRRHVRCDRERPFCAKCRALGLTCEGFSDEVRWVSYDGKNSNNIEVDRHGTRRHLYTEQSRLCMSVTMSSNLVSGSIEASLAEIDLRSQDPDQLGSEDIAVGPFSVLSFDSVASQENQPIQSALNPQGSTPTGNPANALAVTPTPNIMAREPVTGPFTPLADSLGYMDDFLHWSDIIGLGFDNTDFTIEPILATEDSLGLNLQGGRGSGDPFPGMDSDTTCRSLHSDSHRHASWSFAAQRNPSDLLPATLDLLTDAPFLLKHLQDNVIPLMVAIPLGPKSPWKALNMPAAMVTFSDLTILGSRDISHARLANLLALLACSSIHLSLQTSDEAGTSTEHWRSLANRTYQQGKEHIQLSLLNETQTPKRAKYKDQLMALLALVEYSIIVGQQQHTRAFLLDTERLVRLRGFTKHKISQKARLLHHVYTWFRIVGESTYLLHDYSPSKSFLEALNANFQPRWSMEGITSVIPTNESSARLDTFLRLEIRVSDTDLNIDEPKDQETSLRDIHLEDSRNYSETLYKQIYGIPETWLSLLSQTTRLANVMQTLHVARSTSDRAISFDAWDTLNRRSIRLERMICSLNHTHDETGDHCNAPRYHCHMLRALNAALVIFFYRRIRQVDSQILESQVDKVISALEGFITTLPQGQPAGLGSIWPAFIAGCEATTFARRDAIMRWLDQAGASCQFAPYSTAKHTMTMLWHEQDKQLASRVGSPVTWVDIVEREQIWPMFC